MRHETRHPRPAHIPADQWNAMSADERSAMGEWEVKMGRHDPAARTLADRLRAEGHEALALAAEELQRRAEEAEAALALVEAQAPKSVAEMTRLEKVARLAANGMGVHEIAAALDVTAETVRRDLAKVQAPSLHDYDVRHALGEV